MLLQEKDGKHIMHQKKEKKNAYICHTYKVALAYINYHIAIHWYHS